MPALQSREPGARFVDDQAHAAHQMLRVVAFAETIRAIQRSDDAGTDIETFEGALRGLAGFGVAQQFSRVPLSRSAAELGRVATAVLDAIDGSPMPAAEWEPLTEVLADDLAALVGVSGSSLSRYRGNERTTPDEVAARLHVLTLIVSDLLGSYNDFGVRRWFKRSRRALGGRAPGEILSGDWNPHSDDVIAVRELAASLLGASIG